MVYGMAAIFLVMLLLLTIAAYVLARPAVDLSLLAEIKTGMTKQQVTSVLGQPNRTFGEDDWRYWRWGNTGWVEIQFDNLGRVDYVNDESSFP